MQKIIQASFNGQAMHFTADGWFNATSSAARFGKEPSDWLRQREAVEYLTALAADHGNSGFVEELNNINTLPSTSAASQAKLLKLAKQTGFVKTKAGHPDTGGGTWLHPDLAVVFARWLDVRFAFWCDRQIRELIRSEISTHRPATIPSASRDRAVLLHMAVDMVLFRGVGFGKAYSLLNAYAGTHHLAEMSLDQVEQTAQFAGRLMVGSDTRADWSRIAANNPDIDREFAQRGLPYAA